MQKRGGVIQLDLNLKRSEVIGGGSDRLDSQLITCAHYLSPLLELITEINLKLSEPKWDYGTQPLKKIFFLDEKLAPKRPLTPTPFGFRLWSQKSEIRVLLRFDQKDLIL